MRVLVLEDEVKIAAALRSGLEGAGYSVVVAHSGESGSSLVLGESFDLVILDVMLPGRSGIEVLTALRRRGVDTLVLILTARDEIEDRVLGLDSGADDYMTKPFAITEVLARVRALLRRGRPDPVRHLEVGDLAIDVITRAVTHRRERLELTTREYELLEYLVRNKNQHVSRDMLARDVWKEVNRATSLDNVIDVHIARLRRKLGDSGSLAIETVRGVGFVIRDGRV